MFCDLFFPDSRVFGVNNFYENDCVDAREQSRKFALVATQIGICQVLKQSHAGGGGWIQGEGVAGGGGEGEAPNRDKC